MYSVHIRLCYRSHSFVSARRRVSHSHQRINQHMQRADHCPPFRPLLASSAIATAEITTSANSSSRSLPLTKLSSSPVSCARTSTCFPLTLSSLRPPVVRSCFHCHFSPTEVVQRGVHCHLCKRLECDRVDVGVGAPPRTLDMALPVLLAEANEISMLDPSTVWNFTVPNTAPSAVFVMVNRLGFEADVSLMPNGDERVSR